MLTPLDKGSHMGLSLEEIAAADPKWMARFQKDYLYTRFPGRAACPPRALQAQRALPGAPDPACAPPPHAPALPPRPPSVVQAASATTT